MIKSLLTLVLFILSKDVICQYGIKNIVANKNGLPSSNIYSSTIDSKGNIWFCTDKGLSQFNSKDFTNYNISNGLPDNDVLNIFEDKYCKIWLNNLNSELVYIKNNKIFNSSNDETLKKLNNIVNKNKFFIRHISQPLGDTIYFFSKSNVFYKYSNDGNSVESFIKTKKLSIHFLYEYNNKLYAVTNNGIIDFYTEKVINKIDLETKANIKHFITHNGITYFFKNNQLFKLNGKDFEKIIELDNNTNINCLEFLDQNTLLYCSNDSVFRYQIKENEKTFIKGLSNLNINGILKDSEKNVWVTSLNFGAYFLTNNSLNFQTFNPNKNITSVITYQNNLYYGDINGIVYKQNISTTSIEILFNPNPKNSIYTINNVKSLGVDLNHDLWIGYGNLLVKYNLDRKTTETKKVNIKNIEIDSKNEAWITSYYGVTKITNLNINQINESFDYFNNDIFKNYRFYGFCEDSISHNYYLSHDNIFITYNKGIIKQDTLNSRISLIKTKNHNLFWILNQDNALWIYNRKDFIKIPLVNIDGTSTTCNDLFIENDSTIWGCNINQFFRIEIDLKNRKVKSLKGFDLANNINANKIYFHNNTIYLATDIGLLAVKASELKIEKYNIPIYVSEIKINDKIKTLQSRYILNYYENNIAINYNAIYFQKFGDVTYRYKFIGNDTSWHYTKNSTLQFPNLPFGKYHFRINACDKFGYWSSRYADIYFDITPPYYKTIWFIVCSSIALILLIYLFTYYLLKRKNHKKEESLKFQKSLLIEKENALNFKQKQQDAEQKLYAAQVNPHFIFNSLNSIQGFILKSNPKEAYNYIEIFSSLIRSVLVNSKTESIPVKEDIENLKKYLTLEKLRFADKLTYEIIFESEIPDNKNMPSMLLQPYVENAIWHGLMTKKTNGLLKITYKIKENYIFISIIDNGIGRELAASFPKNNNGTGSGLKLCEERLKLYSQKINKTYSIEIIDLKENNIASGTQVNLTIPLT